MKPLILSFFVVLLVYSLFFDKEKGSKLRVPDPVRLSLPEAMKIEHKSDSIKYYAEKTNFRILKLMNNDNLFN